MKKNKTILKMAGLIVAILAMTSLMSTTVFAVQGLDPEPTPTSTPTVDAGTEACRGIKDAFGGTCNAAGNGEAEQKKIGTIIATVVNIMSFLIGGVSVIMLIIGGFKYIIASGDPNSISSAKNTILYAVIGLGVVLTAQVIVKYVIAKIAPVAK